MFKILKNHFGFYDDDMPIESGLYGVKSYRKGDNKRMVTPDGKWFIEERSFRIAYTFILNIDNKETPTLGHLKRVAQVRGDLARKQIDEVEFNLYGKAGKPSIPTEEQKRSGYSSQAEYNRDDRNAVRLRSVKFGDQHDDLLAHLNKKNWGL